MSDSDLIDELEALLAAGTTARAAAEAVLKDEPADRPAGAAGAAGADTSGQDEPCPVCIWAYGRNVNVIQAGVKQSKRKKVRRQHLDGKLHKEAVKKFKAENAPWFAALRALPERRQHQVGDMLRF